MKKNGLILCFCLLFVTSLLGANPLALKLIEECLFTSDFGNPVPSYEDVDDITNIGPRADNTGPMIKHSELNAFKNTVVRASTGQAFINKINETGGRVLHEPGFLHFMKTYMYIEAGGYDEEGDWHSNGTMANFPQDYDPGDKPHSKSFYLCLNPGWWYIPALSYPPNAKSCDVCTDLCDLPPCEKVEVEKDDDGDGIPDRTEEEFQHHQPTNNVYENLGNYLYGTLQPGPAIGKDASGKVFTMTFADRTPPRIIGCVGDQFPELGVDTPAKTGDWYKIEGLKIKDNKSDKVGSCLCLGKIDGYPATDWMASCDWVKEEPFRIVDSDADAQYVIMPNSCHGVMLYSIFAWDKSGLLNPGEPLIEEDKPEICYGLRNPPDGVSDLGKHPLDAVGWPSALTLPLTDENLLSVDPDAIDPNQHRSRGFINIIDNDLPNIVIKFKSVKDGKCVFFPPAVQPADLPILTSSEYKKPLGIADANAVDYENFIGDLTEAVFTSDLVDEAKPVYFKIYEILPSPVMDPGEHGLLERLKSPSSEDDWDFIRKAFRLEDYQESDSDVNGAPISGDEDTFGKRNGTGGEVTALLTEPLQEDVEYLVSVWADDNVKWATKDESGVVLPLIHPIPTGIVDGSIKIEIPNQYPKVSHNVPLDPGQAVSPEIRVVFREPTPSGDPGSISDLDYKKYPFIEVYAKDFAGMTRKIKLYVKVSNEKPDIRVLERQHRPGN